MLFERVWNQSKYYFMWYNAQNRIKLRYCKVWHDYVIVYWSSYCTCTSFIKNCMSNQLALASGRPASQSRMARVPFSLSSIFLKFFFFFLLLLSSRSSFGLPVGRVPTRISSTREALATPACQTQHVHPSKTGHSYFVCCQTG